jgi:hypothetical protein
VMILAAEIWLSRDVFASQCNWNHLL